MSFNLNNSMPLYVEKAYAKLAKMPVGIRESFSYEKVSTLAKKLLLDDLLAMLYREKEDKSRSPIKATYQTLNPA